MGLMDKVKAQATQLAQKTQEAAQEGRARLDQAQANRRGDILLRQLGAAVFAERTGRGTADSQATIDRLITAISTHERENGLNLSQASAPGPDSTADPAGSTSTPPSDPSDPGTPSSSAAADPSAAQQDVPGGFPQSGQTFFPPPEDS
jgi:hypothetical protein